MTASSDDAIERPVPEIRNDRPLVLLLGLGLVLAAAAGTQYAAWRLGFPRALGLPVLVLGSGTSRALRAVTALFLGTALTLLVFPTTRRVATPLLLGAISAALASVGAIYPPHGLLVWSLGPAHNPATMPALRSAWLVTGAMALVVTRLVVSMWHHGARGPPSAAHGSARWGQASELDRPTGFVLARQGNCLLRFQGEGHVLTVAPTRSGKGVSCVIPNLLEYPGSVLVTDPKGENYAVTARRRRELGHAVHALDPFDLVGGLAALNPLDLVDPASVDAIDDARLIADMLVLQEGREGELAFWNEEARSVLTGIILHVAASAPPELRSLSHVRTLLTLPPASFRELVRDMRESQAAGGLVARAAARLDQKAEKERSGVISTAQSHTHFLDSPRMARVLDQSTCDFGSLKRDRASFYLVLPAERFGGYARWLRLMIACGLLAVARSRGQPRERVLFLLDEFAHLGRMQPVQRDIGLAGGHGVTFWLIVQDLSQLRTAYPESWPTFLANVDVLQGFGVNDWETAEYLSKLTGETTVTVTSENHSTGLSRGPHPYRQRGVAVTHSETGRRLLLPDEVRRLPADHQLLFLKGMAPLLLTRCHYLRDRWFLGQYDPNPLYRAVGETHREGASGRLRIAG